MPVHAGQEYCAVCGIDAKFDTFRQLYEHVVNEHDDIDAYWQEHARISHLETCIAASWAIEWFYQDETIPGSSDETSDGWSRVEPEVIG